METMKASDAARVCKTTRQNLARHDAELEPVRDPWGRRWYSPIKIATWLLARAQQRTELANRWLQS